MKRKAIILFLFLSYMTLSSYARLKITEVTYVGNTGFLIKTADKKIYIDAQFDSSNGKNELPQKVQDKLSSAQAPFDNIDLILVTHSFMDYLSPELIKDYLDKNPNAFFASTGPMVNALKEFPDRCVSFNPAKEKPDRKVINDITIEAFYFPSEQNALICNIGFVVSIDGQTIFQTDHFETKIYKSESITNEK